MKGCIAYKNITFRKATRVIIGTAHEIIEEYSDAGYDLTLRQLYYQFVARDIIPNTEREYKKLGSIINNARLAGYISWDAIVDRTRQEQGDSHWEDPGEVLQTVAEQFTIDTRETQPVYMEVWVEKDALIGVLEGICDSLDVTYMSCRGYISQSAMWRAALRFNTQEEAGKDVVLLYLGDHDPSGINMGHDIQNRFEIFETETMVQRIALTDEQIDEHSPPPNPAKVTDSRYAAYQKKHGDQSWELDALKPQVLTKIIHKAVNEHTDKKLLKVRQDAQYGYRAILQNIADNWKNCQKKS